MLIEYTKNGRRVNAHRQVAKVLIARGLAREVAEGDSITPAAAAQSPVVEAAATPAAPAYETRALQATDNPAPYGLKADGTPRKRPGRAPIVKAGEEE